MKRHLIWIGHTGGVTGLGRVSDNLLARLAKHWRISIVSIYNPDGWECPYGTLYPARLFNDCMGKLRYQRLCYDDPPDMTVAYIDPFLLPEWKPFRHHTPFVAYMPVDALNAMDAPALAGVIDYGIFLTAFGQRETQQCGYHGPSTVIGHGVDPALYFPRDKREARARLGLPQDAFIVGNVNRNQPRKRFDVTLLAFKAFLERVQPVQECLLYCHCAPVDIGVGIPNLAKYWGVDGQVRFPPVDMAAGGFPEAEMSWMYSALDVQVSTCQGEGFGLCHIEGMACGVPQIVPNFAALADTEWTQTVALHVPATHVLATVEATNLIGATPDPAAVGASIALLYRRPNLRADYARRSFQWSRTPRFNWDVLATRFHDTLTEVLHGHSARRDAPKYRGLAQRVD